MENVLEKPEVKTKSINLKLIDKVKSLLQYKIDSLENNSFGMTSETEIGYYSGKISAFEEALDILNETEGYFK